MGLEEELWEGMPYQSNMYKENGGGSEEECMYSCHLLCIPYGGGANSEEGREGHSYI